MNERIRELKNKVLDEHFNYTWTTMDYQDVEKFADKFAELIVKECAVVAYSYEPTEEYVTKIAELIMQNFGVKR